MHKVSNSARQTSAAHRGKRQFDLIEDDFSVQISSPEDPMFWVRVEKSSEGRAVVSDLKRSGLSDDQIADALAIAVQHATQDPIAELRFLDLAPSARDVGVAEKVAKAEAALITKMLAAFSKKHGVTIARVELARRLDKFDLLASV